MKTALDTKKEDIPDDIWQMVKYRMIQSMPANARLAIGGEGSFSKEEIIEHLNKKDDTGELIVKMQLEMIRYMTKA